MGDTNYLLTGMILQVWSTPTEMKSPCLKPCWRHVPAFQWRFGIYVKVFRGILIVSYKCITVNNDQQGYLVIPNYPLALVENPPNEIWRWNSSSTILLPCSGSRNMALMCSDAEKKQLLFGSLGDVFLHLFKMVKIKMMGMFSQRYAWLLHHFISSSLEFSLDLRTFAAPLLFPLKWRRLWLLPLLGSIWPEMRRGFFGSWWTLVCLSSKMSHDWYLVSETSTLKWLFQLDDSKSLHWKWVFHQTFI